MKNKSNKKVLSKGKRLNWPKVQNSKPTPLAEGLNSGRFVDVSDGKQAAHSAHKFLVA